MRMNHYFHWASAAYCIIYLPRGTIVFRQWVATWPVAMLPAIGCHKTRGTLPTTGWHMTRGSAACHRMAHDPWQRCQLLIRSIASWQRMHYALAVYSAYITRTRALRTVLWTHDMSAMKHEKNIYFTINFYYYYSSKYFFWIFFLEIIFSLFEVLLEQVFKILNLIIK